MLGEKRTAPSNKTQPTQKTPQEVDTEKRLAVGDVISVKDNDPQCSGLYVVADISHNGEKVKAIPVKLDEKNNKLSLDKTRKTIELDMNSPNITRESLYITNQQVLKNPEQEIDKNKQKEHAVSFSVVSKGSPDGLVTDGNSYERIVTGTTVNGVTYKASLSSGEVSKSTLNNIADAIAKSRDYTNESLDERKAYDDVQDVVNQSPDIETVHIDGGPTINRDEIGFEVSTPNGAEHIDPLNPDGNIKDDIADDLADGEIEDDIEIPEQMGKPTTKSQNNEMDYSPSIDEVNKAFADEYGDGDDEPVLGDSWMYE